MRGHYQNEVLMHRASRVGEISDEDAATLRYQLSTAEERLEKNQSALEDRLIRIERDQPSPIVISLIFGMVAATWWKAKDI